MEELEYLGSIFCSILMLLDYCLFKNDHKYLIILGGVGGGIIEKIELLNSRPMNHPPSRIWLSIDF